MLMMRHILLCVLLVIAIPIGTFTQGQSEPVSALTTFEAASIREMSDTSFVSPRFQPGGRFVMRGTIAMLMGQAYGRFTFVDGPPWITQDLYDVMAVAAREPSADERV